MALPLFLGVVLLLSTRPGPFSFWLPGELPCAALTTWTHSSPAYSPIVVEEFPSYYYVEELTEHSSSETWLNSNIHNGIMVDPGTLEPNFDTSNTLSPPLYHLQRQLRI